MKKGSGEIYHQLPVRFSPETSKILQDRAKRNGRSLSKEVVRLVEAQLVQEKGTGQSALEENR